MDNWHYVAQGVHDSFTLILVILLACGFLVGWLVFQTLRSAETRGEMVRLRRKLNDLEVERAHAYSSATASPVALVDPVVLSLRWIRKGAAATTSDGGCLVIIDDVAPQAKTALMTVRVDGAAVLVRHKVRRGHPLQAEGTMGTYTVQVAAVEPLRTMVGVSLRSRHVQAAS
jgi:uncharacterized membrane protein YciS (DUF1049 family)